LPSLRLLRHVLGEMRLLLLRHVLGEVRLLRHVLGGMFVAGCASFVISFLVIAIQVGDESKEPVTPGVMIFFPLYFLLWTSPVYLPLGACAGLAWSRVLDGASRLAVVRRGAVLGLIVAAIVGVPLAYGWLTRPIPVGHPGEPPRTRPPVSELIVVELSLFAPFVGGYSAWAWLASRHFSEPRSPKKVPPWPEV